MYDVPTSVSMANLSKRMSRKSIAGYPPSSVKAICLTNLLNIFSKALMLSDHTIEVYSSSIYIQSEDSLKSQRSFSRYWWYFLYTYRRIKYYCQTDERGTDTFYYHYIISILNLHILHKIETMLRDLTTDGSHHFDILEIADFNNYFII